jgi:hypothetical protein
VEGAGLDGFMLDSLGSFGDVSKEENSGGLDEDKEGRDRMASFKVDLEVMRRICCGGWRPDAFELAARGDAGTDGDRNND